MIGFDTNILLRIIVKDDPAQTARVMRLIDELEVQSESTFIADIVLCELAWTLRSSYKRPGSEIALVLASVYNTENFYFQSQDQIVMALQAYESGRGDFSDYLIHETDLRAGCNRVATFDRKLLNEPGFIEP